MEYKFNLKFKLTESNLDDESIMDRMGTAGCTDALVGLGTPGYIGMEFIREANSEEEALISAIADVKSALPSAILI